MNRSWVALLAALFITVAFSGVGSASAGGYFEPLSKNLLWISGLEPTYSLKKGLVEAKRCLEPAPSLSSLCDLVGDLKLRSQTTSDLSELSPASVLYVGERHLVSDARLFLIRNLQALKSYGFKTLALEMWNASAQADLDRFINNEFDIEWVRQNFKKHWSYDSTTYIQLMEEAHKLGFKVLALDIRDKMNRKAGLSFAQEILVRDQAMAQVLSQELVQAPNDKIIALTGRWHSYSRVADKGQQLSQSQMLSQFTKLPITNLIVINGQEFSPLSFSVQVLGLSNKLVKVDSQIHFSDFVYINK
jgi:hypothetical protein